MDVYTAIHDRRDEQAWAPETPSRELLERVIEAAVWAPNHRLSEPWRFHVLAGDARTALADAIVAWLAANGGSERAQGAVHGRLLRAPLVIAVVQAGRARRRCQTPARGLRGLCCWHAEPAARRTRRGARGALQHRHDARRGTGTPRPRPGRPHRRVHQPRPSSRRRAREGGRPQAAGRELAGGIAGRHEKSNRSPRALRAERACRCA